MWLQTTYGNFAVAREAEDHQRGMLILQSSSYDDLSSVSCRWLNNVQVRCEKNETFPYYVRVPESVLGLAIAQMASSVWYSALPTAMKTLYGEPESSNFGDMQLALSYDPPDPFDLEGLDEVKETLIFEVGVEGGSLSIGIKEHGGCKMYVAHLYDSTPCLLDEKDGGGRAIIRDQEFSNWDDALKHLARHPWWRFSPMHIAHEYRDLVRVALRRQGVDPETDRWALALGLDESGSDE
jgi:hypothetical protein